MGFWQSLFGISYQTPQPALDEYHTQSLANLRVASQLLGLQNIGDRGTASITAAYRGGQLLADMAATLPWGAIRGGKRADTAVTGPPVPAPTPPLLLDPSPYMTRDETIEMMVGSLIWRGYAPVLLQNLDSSGRPRFASPLHPDEVTVTWNTNMTQPVYHWRGRPMIEGVDIAVAHMPKLPGDPKGLGPFEAAKATLRGVLDANDYARRLFSDSAVPSGYLKHPGKLTHPEAVDLMDTWDDTHQGGRGTGVVSGGVEYVQLSMTPEQAQFLLTRAFGIQEVARLLGIPAHILNAGTPPQSANSLTYTNVPAVRSELVTLTLYPTYLRRIEGLFTRLLPRGMSAAFDLADILKGDDKSRFEAAKVAIDAGILTVDEARARENLAPLPQPTTPAQEVVSVDD